MWLHSSAPVPWVSEELFVKNVSHLFFVVVDVVDVVAVVVVDDVVVVRDIQIIRDTFLALI